MPRLSKTDNVDVSTIAVRSVTEQLEYVVDLAVQTTELDPIVRWTSGRLRGPGCRLCGGE